MFHVVLLLLVVGISVLGWLMVNSSPRVLAMVLSPKLAFGTGAGFFILGLFCAFFAAMYMGSSELVIGCLIQSFAGLYFVFACSAGLRGSPEYDQTVKRVGIMLALLIATIVGIFYVPDTHAVAAFDLALITAGFYLASDYLRHPQRR